MHDVLRARLVRAAESLPEEQLYQLLDYIEFLQSKYGPEGERSRAGGFQRLAEGIEDRLRSRSVDPSALREAFQVLASADRAFSGLASAGRQILDELRGSGSAPASPDPDRHAASGGTDDSSRARATRQTDPES